MNTWKCKVLALATLLLIFTAYQATAQVHAAFTADVTHACSPLVVHFTDHSTGSPTSYHWDLGNGNISTQKNPGAIYLQPGTKTITLIVSDGTTNDTLVMPNYIQVFSNPVTNFTYSPTNGCLPWNACFTDSSVAGSAPIVKWAWDFGDGQADSAQNPCVTYNTAGNFSVSLFVQDSNGCSNQVVKPNLMTVKAKPIAAFTSNVNSSCTAPLTVNFYNSSTFNGTLNYLWYFGDGGQGYTSSPTHNYNLNGVYDVTLIVYDNNYHNDGCIDTLIKPGYIAVEQLIAKFAAPTHGCIGTAISFVDSSTSHPNIFRWDFGDGTTSILENPQHVYNAAGTYTIKFYAANSGLCADSVTKVNYITIDPSPTAAFGANNLGSCLTPLSVNFTDSSRNAVSWLWNFGDSTTSTLRNPQHSYTNPGNYDVSLTVTNNHNCSITILKPSYINVVEPKAAFSANRHKGCAPLPVAFTDSSTSFENIVSWHWDFGDGTTSNAQNPTHVFTHDSIYDITLIIVNAAGCTDTLLKPAYIKAGSRPTASFTATPLLSCLNVPVSFTGVTTNADHWMWQYGDGTTDSFTQSSTHNFADTGLYTITYIALKNGCPDTVVKPNYIYVAPPRAGIKVTQNCPNPYSVKFTDKSLVPTSWYWSFGDSTNSTDQNPVHNYATRGSYVVTLSVTDSMSGCTDITAVPITVTKPVPNFIDTVRTGCRPFNTSFTDSSIDAVAYQWVTANQSANAKNPIFTYNTPGIYDAKLVITDLNGCKDSLIKPSYITVKGPTANFGGSPLTGCAPLPVSFVDSTVGFLGNIASWKWYFGDGDSSSLQNPTHTYLVTGSYNIVLTATDVNGCSNTAIKLNYVTPTYPKPSFTSPTYTCTNKTVTFTNTSNAYNGTYHWQFGDGDSSNVANPTHQYTREGTYTITLKAVDGNGCDSTLTIPQYIVVKNPVAGFTADSIFSNCPPLRVNFRDTSSGNAVAWVWDFGDGTTSTLQNPAHTYRTPGNFTIKLMITTNLGCTDSITMNNLVVVKGPYGSFSFTPKNTCQGSAVTFNAVTTNTVARNWDFGDGIVRLGADTLTHVYDSSGIYHPVVVLDDGLGCLFPLATTDSIVVGFLNPDFTNNPPYICKQGDVIFTNTTTTSTPVTSWFWDFGDGDTSSLQNPIHFYHTSGIFNVKLKATNSTCVDSIIKSSLITVDRGPQASFTINAYSGCMPLATQFTNTSTSDSAVSSILWDFGNGHTDSISQNPSQLYDTAKVYTISLIVISTASCADTFTKNITVHPLPIATVSHDTTICYSYSAPVHASGGALYHWSPGTGLSDSTAANLIAKPLVTTNYYLTVTDTFGCQAFDSLHIRVNPLPAASVSNDRVICAGEHVEIDAYGGDNYQWTPADSLSCTTCSNPVANPSATTNYQVRVSTLQGCFVDASVNVTVHPMPNGLLQHHAEICRFDSVVLKSAGGTQFHWSPPVGLSCTNCGTTSASPINSTFYTLSIENQYGCGFNDTVNVIVHQLPILQITAPDSICYGTSTPVAVTGAASYVWTPNSTVNCDTCANIIATPTSKTLYKVVGTDVFGCKNNDSTWIKVNPTPTVHTIPNLNLCKTDRETLHTIATDANAFNWTPSTGLDDSSWLSPIAMPMQTTLYKVKASNPYGCNAYDSVLITVINKVHTLITSDTTICSGNSVQLHAQILQQGHTGTQVIWKPINGFENANSLNPITTPTHTQLYTFLAFSGSCIPDTQHVTIYVSPSPTVQIAPVPEVVEGSMVKLLPIVSAGVIKYQWNSESGLSCSTCEHPEVIAKGSATYSVIVTDSNGCQASADIKLNDIGLCGGKIFVPNYFTPNGDGNNEKLLVRGLGVEEMKYFRVFDRWGNLMFETKNINEGWDGTVKGHPVNSGVFVYSVEGVCTNGAVFQKQGNVTLLR